MKLSIIVKIRREQETDEGNDFSFLQRMNLHGAVAERELIVVDEGGRTLREAVRVATGDVVLICEDLENPDADLFGRLLAPIIEGRADIVYGLRRGADGPRSLAKRLKTTILKALAWFTNKMNGLELSGTDPEYRLFPKRVLDRLKLIEIPFDMESDIAVKTEALIRSEGLRLHEVFISGGNGHGITRSCKSAFFVLKYSETRLARFFRYCLVGGVVAMTQMLATVGLVEIGNMHGILGENIANIVAIEFALLSAFFLHRSISWRNSRGSFGRQIVRFHLVSFFSVLFRIIAFAVFAIARMPYRINTLIGIVVAVLINFFGYDRLVFPREKSRNKE